MLDDSGGDGTAANIVAVSFCPIDRNRMQHKQRMNAANGKKNCEK